MTTSLEELFRIIQMRDTKANITAFTGTLEEAVVAYATDTSELGIYTGGGWVWIASGGVDSDAIHDNVASEIHAITEKASPVGADELVIEDSADSYNKKRAQITNLPTGADADAIHDNVAGEINAIAEKASPVNADLVIIEDSADSNNKKKAQLGNLPGGSAGDSTYTAAYASRPAASNDGDLFIPDDGYDIERDTGAAWEAWGPLFPMTAPPSTGWAWINQGGASVDTTKGGIVLNVPGSATANNFRIYKRSAPSAPYTITAAIITTMHPSSGARFGLCFRQSSDGKLATFTLELDGSLNSLMRSSKFTDPNTLSAHYLASTTEHPDSSHIVFLRIADNGTNRICSYSLDGQNFVTYHSIGDTNFLTADEVGFFGNSGAAAGQVYVNLLSWKES